MGAPERAFRPETIARRERKAERDARLKAAALEALDIGRPRAQARDIMDVAVDEAVATVGERGAVQRARGGVEVQAAQRALAAKKAEHRGQQAAGKSSRKPQTIDEYLESLSQRQRETIEESGWFQCLDKRHQADVRRRLRVLDEIEEEAELEFQAWKEEQALANLDTLADSREWEAEQREAYDERSAARLAAESDAENAYWGVSAEEMQRASEDIARAAAGGPEEDVIYSDDTAEGWDVGDEEEV